MTIVDATGTPSRIRAADAQAGSPLSPTGRAETSRSTPSPMLGRREAATDLASGFPAPAGVGPAPPPRQVGRLSGFRRALTLPRGPVRTEAVEASAKEITNRCQRLSEAKELGRRGQSSKRVRSEPRSRLSLSPSCEPPYRRPHKGCRNVGLAS